LQVTTAVTEALEWMDENQDAEQEDYEEKLKEVQDACNPIVSAAYQAGGGPGGEEDDSDMGDHDEL
jgi:endoplasmic reticulum chaperone BiP